MKRLISTALAILALSLAGYATGYRVAVIPVEFQDIKFNNRLSETAATLLQAQKYFNDQFTPYRSYSFELLPVVTLPKNLYWYGANSTVRSDERIDQLARDAISLLQDRDFSVYDNDGDGKIENICFIAAGGSESDGAGAEYIWPQHLTLRERGGVISVNGKTADSITVCTETSPLGTFCHEFCHSLGLQDLYDTDGSGSGGTSKGLWGSLSIMDGGLKNNGGTTPPNFCAIELEQLGIGSPVPTSYGFHSLRPVNSSREYLKLNSDVENEYFLLECRNEAGWDAFIGGKGLFIYHVDRSTNNSWYSDYYRRNLSASERWSSNQVNCRPDHQCAMVITAIPGTGDLRKVSFPQEGRNSFGSETDPSFRYWSGSTSNLVIKDIAYLSDGSMGFNIITPIAVREISVFQDAAILSWSIDNTLEVQKCEAACHPEGDHSAAKTLSVDAKSNGIGLFSATLEKLSPSTKYVAVIKLLCKDGTSYSVSNTFTTKSYQKESRPFIYLNFTNRNDDGSFPAGARLSLRVYNASNVEKLEWTFNNRYISTGTSGYWEVSGSGILEARLWYSDGSIEVIQKKIVVQ